MEVIKRIIYADNAATTKIAPVALEQMVAVLSEEYANPSQPYSFSRRSKELLKQARVDIAACINADSDEIFFTSGGTESDNWAIKGSAFLDAEHRATITSQIEHHALLHSCAAIERVGYPVAYLPVTVTGSVLPETLERYISDRTRLVSVMTANNEIGTVQPITDLAEIAHKHGAVFHTDAVQAVGHIQIDVQKLGVDMLSASAHKFNGPRGTGFLYIRKGTRIAPYLDGGAQEAKMRAGTENVAAIVGMAIALKQNCGKLEGNIEHLKHLEIVLLSELDRNNVVYRRNGINALPGLLSLSFSNFNGETLLHRLDLKGICVSTGSACNGSSDELSHVLQAIHLDEKTAHGTIRISLGHDNTEEEIHILARTLLSIIKRQ